MIVNKQYPDLLNLKFWDVYSSVKSQVETDFLAHLTHVQVVLIILGIYFYYLKRNAILSMLRKIGMTSN